MSISLQSSVRTCKVETGNAVRTESDRFLNPNNMVCVPWNGMNSKGQEVCADSFYTKSVGCNSALDRVSVENVLRPSYAAYINLNMAGLGGDIYDGGVNETAHNRAGCANAWQDDRKNITGSFGNSFPSTNIPTCGLNSYERAMALASQTNRQASANSDTSRNNRCG